MVIQTSIGAVLAGRGHRVGSKKNWLRIRQTRRGFLKRIAGAGAAVAVPFASCQAVGANEAIRLGFIGCGKRAERLLSEFAQIDGVRITGLCDPDRRRLQTAAKRFPSAKQYDDLRRLLDDLAIDAVVLALPVHWHALATVWAVQAGKDVYCEKPMTHNFWEARYVAAVVHKSGRIFQHGTQQRSDPMRAEIRRFLHEEQALGKLLWVQANRYAVRPPIGKRSTPLPIPEDMDYPLWLGPAQDLPIYRNQLHYDWHWDWNTGAGEMGNWGVHVLDDVRNNLFLDQIALPRRIGGGGGRVVFDDAGQTPNFQFIYFDTGLAPVVMALSNLPATPGARAPGPHTGPASGYVAYCEGGRLEAVTSPFEPVHAIAFDSKNKVIRKFSGPSGNILHQRNFIEAVRRRNPSVLNAPVRSASDTTCWCHLANVVVRVGRPLPHTDMLKELIPSGPWDEAIHRMAKLLRAHGLDFHNESLRWTAMLTFDSAAERFTGSEAEAANAFLKRTYRPPFLLPISNHSQPTKG